MCVAEIAATIGVTTRSIERTLTEAFAKLRADPRAAELLRLWRER